MQQLIIDRSKWRFGGDGQLSKLQKFGRTRLLNDAGYKCCLGFACEQLYDWSEKEIKDEGDPTELYTVCSVEADLDDTIFPLSVKLAESEASVFENAAIEINDDFKPVNPSERETKLIELFAQVDVALSFVGEYAPGAV